MCALERFARALDVGAAPGVARDAGREPGGLVNLPAVAEGGAYGENALAVLGCGVKFAGVRSLVKQNWLSHGTGLGRTREALRGMANIGRRKPIWVKIRRGG